MTHVNDCCLGSSSDFIDKLHKTKKSDGGFVVPFFTGCEYTVSNELFDMFKSRCLEERAMSAIWYLIHRQRGEKAIPCVQVIYPFESEVMTFDLVKEYDD